MCVTVKGKFFSIFKAFKFFIKIIYNMNTLNILNRFIKTLIICNDNVI